MKYYYTVSRALCFSFQAEVGVHQDVWSGVKSGGAAGANSVIIRVRVCWCCLSGVVVVDEQEETCRVERHGH